MLEDNIRNGNDRRFHGRHCKKPKHAISNQPEMGGSRAPGTNQGKYRYPENRKKNEEGEQHLRMEK
jgi:hypothetical protein